MSAATAAARNPRRSRAFKALVQNRTTLVGLVLVALVLVFAAAGWFLDLPDPNQVKPSQRLKGASAQNWLGTDQFGRDILARLVSGAKLSLSVAFSSVTFALLIGATVGAIAGFVGGVLDDILMRLIDIMMAFPYVILAIAVAAAVGPSVQNIVLILAIIRTPLFARVGRAAVIAIKEQEYVTAAKALGQRPFRVLLRHVIPNSLTSLIVISALSIASVINAEAAISFLGLGIRPPQATWGNMLADAQDYVLTVPTLGIAPGVMISLTVLGFQLLGDGLRDILDPRFGK